MPGVVIGATGATRCRLYRPPGVNFGERLPLMVMLHGCGQDVNSFASSTRMNRIAMRERFLVLYPEQDRLANGQGCWNWFDTGTGRAYGEAALVMKAVDQVCLLHPVVRARVAIAGLSAGAGMAALLATRHPGRFKAVVMHSGIPPGPAHSTLPALGAMKGHRSTMPLAAKPSTMEANWPPLLLTTATPTLWSRPTTAGPPHRSGPMQRAHEPALPVASREASATRCRSRNSSARATPVVTLVAVGKLAMHGVVAPRANHSATSKGRMRREWRGPLRPGSFGPWCEPCPKRLPRRSRTRQKMPWRQAWAVMPADGSKPWLRQTAMAPSYRSSLEAYATPARTQRGRATVCA
jgi:poly(hydroxyalkanoate) depolymerase family esterase